MCQRKCSTLFLKYLVLIGFSKKTQKTRSCIQTLLNLTQTHIIHPSTTSTSSPPNPSAQTIRHRSTLQPNLLMVPLETNYPPTPCPNLMMTCDPYSSYSRSARTSQPDLSKSDEAEPSNDLTERQRFDAVI